MIASTRADGCPPIVQGLPGSYVSERGSSYTKPFRAGPTKEFNVGKDSIAFMINIETSEAPRATGEWAERPGADELAARLKAEEEEKE